MLHFTLAIFSDVGGWEITLCCVIALLLFGKELPQYMRTMGRYYAQFKLTLDNAKGEFTREMENAAREMENTKKEIGLDKPLVDQISLTDDQAAHGPTPTPELTVNPPYNPPTQPPEAIDQGPGSLDKLSAAPIPTTPVAAPVAPAEPASVPVPKKIPDPVSTDASTATPLPAIESPKPVSESAAIPHAEETKPDAISTTLDELEKRIAPPKKIPSPIA